MIEAELGGSPATYQRLMQSPNWVPFYDDGRIVMFGRADAPEPDLAFFKANRLDPELRAFRDRPSRARRRTPSQPDLDDRCNLPDADSEPVALTNPIGTALARSHKFRRPNRNRQFAAPTRSGPLPARHPGSPDGAREKSGRLGRLSHPQAMRTATS